MVRLLERHRYLPHLIVGALTILTFVALSLPRNIRGGASLPVTLELPEQLGPYLGERMLFCQNDQCLAVFKEREIEGEKVCVHCGGALDTISPGEKMLLPADTPILRRIYAVPGQPHVHITVVFSGKDRRSIHRPQVCLAGQGHSIRNESLIDIPIEGRASPLRVALLDLVQPITLPDGSSTYSLGAYSYWFFNPERETASHVARLVRMAYDNVVRGYRPRWAYVIVATQRLPNDERHLDRIKDFINLIEPVISAERAAMAAME